MTVGKDVSALFPDVVNCMQTDNLELKKLVYLYLMNYAKSQPDMAIMAVNTFVKVSKSKEFGLCYYGNKYIIHTIQIRQFRLIQFKPNTTQTQNPIFFV